MPLTERRHLRRTRLPWLIGSLPVVLGMVIIFWQAERILQQTARTTANGAVEQFDLILDNVAQAATAILPLAGQPCARAVLSMREQVTRRPYVRSTNLVRGDTLYCSSLFGDYQEAVDPADYVGGHLWLLAGNAVTPTRALLIYRLASPTAAGAALSTVDGYHLINSLRMIGGDTELRLQVGTRWLTADGHVHEAPLPPFDVAPFELRSARYPFSIETGYTAAQRWALIGREYPPMLGLLLVLGVATGLLSRWALRRAASPRQELKRALDAEEFMPFYQPIVCARDGHCAGVEVLMRWQHPKEGLVRPDLFIPLAEHSGLIVPMTQLLLRQVSEHLAAHAELLGTDFHVSINFTAGHFLEPTLFQECETFLAAFAPGTVKLVLELTERELVRPTRETLALFERLRGLGVAISIDDFGTGHSSLAYLREFRVDYLKIDQSFVAMIGVDALSSHILDSIIELAGKLDLRIIAEGVETAEQGQYLAAQAVDYLQGYRYARPMPLADLVHHMKAERSAPHP